MTQRILQIVCAILVIALIVFVLTREPRRPQLPKWEAEQELRQSRAELTATKSAKEADVKLIKSLLGENLSKRRFSFPLVVTTVSGKKVIPLSQQESAATVQAAILKIAKSATETLSSETSPIRQLKRINEASRFFEEALLESLNTADGLRCEIPPTSAGKYQRSGYPDLMITHLPTGEIYYLDPKLLHQDSVGSSLRTFYFEPKSETLKINQDASHLLLGIEHDGNSGAWKFEKLHLVDLSNLQVRLKAEFQAANKELYRE